VKISVPENEISQIKKGLKAKFKVAALNNQTFEGEVCNVGIVADQISRTYEVKIKVKNLEQVLKPGMVCDVELDVKTIHSITAVDYRAISKDKDNNCFVYIVNTNTKTVKKRIIQVADYVNNKIEIVSGVETGEIVITEGKQKLFDNSKISL
jgi:RND family efflux transporter MFP subunit